jgi:hypothetical protein
MSVSGPQPDSLLSIVAWAGLSTCDGMATPSAWRPCELIRVSSLFQLRLETQRMLTQGIVDRCMAPLLLLLLG